LKLKYGYNCCFYW